MTFELRESTYRYLTEPDVAAGVEALADHAVKKLPSSLSWPEVPKFYRALLAAQQVKIEWAISHEELWRAVWSDAVAGWDALSPDEQEDQDEDSAVTVDICWDDEWFGRAFRKGPGPMVLWASVSIDTKGFYAGFDLLRRSTPLIKSLDGFTSRKGYSGLWTSATDAPLARVPNLETLRGRATSAVREAEVMLVAA